MRVFSLIRTLPVALLLVFALSYSVPVRNAAAPLFDWGRVVEQMGARLHALYPNVPKRTAAQIVQVTHELAAQKRLDPCIVLGVIAKESSFRPSVISNQDYGLMQVNVRYHPDEVKRVGGASRLLELRSNIDAGTNVLSKYRARSGSEQEMLNRYHGLGKSQTYSRTVLRHASVMERHGICQQSNA